MKVSGTTCISPADTTAKGGAGSTRGCWPCWSPAESSLSSLPPEQGCSPDPGKSAAHLSPGWSPGGQGLPTGWSEWDVLKWKRGLGGRNMPQQAGQMEEKGICTVERAHLLLNRLCLRQCCCQPHSRKHHFFPPTALPCYKHPSSISSLCLAGALLAWVAAAAAAGEKAAACHCSHFREKVNGCGKCKGRETGEDSTGKKHMRDLKHRAGILRMPFSGLEQSASLACRNTAYRDRGATRF